LGRCIKPKKGKKRVDLKNTNLINVQGKTRGKKQSPLQTEKKESTKESPLYSPKKGKEISLIKTKTKIKKGERKKKVKKGEGSSIFGNAPAEFLQRKKKSAV